MTRRGMTLVEMLVAMTATLLLMGVIAQVFSVFGSAISDSRSVIELDGRMRVAAWQLRSDLAGVTAPTLPPMRPDADAGYFEIIEGPNTDAITYYDPFSGTIAPPFSKLGNTPGPKVNGSDDRLLGDTDDVLLFTTRSTDAPFLGKWQNGKYESPVAEVAWFLRPARTGTATATTNPTTYTLYRRQLLVVGHVGAAPFLANQNSIDTQMQSGTWSSWQKFYGDFDLSARGAGNAPMTFIPNTLGDLTRRESRFMHNSAGDTSGTGYPYRFPENFQDVSAPAQLTFAGTDREGEDVVLSNVIAFDMRVFDPTAAVQLNGNTPLAAGDPGFNSGAGIGVGGYVDLGNGDNSTTPAAPSKPRFGNLGYTNSLLDATDNTAARTWDTWSTHYETDGVDQDAWTKYGPDQGTNGLDDNSDGLVDNGPADLDGDGWFISAGEAGELETIPPYPAPLRGIEVRLRCYEPSSRQVRQITIRHSLVR